MNQVKWVDQVPNWKGLTAKDVWHSVSLFLISQSTKKSRHLKERMFLTW